MHNSIMVLGLLRQVKGPTQRSSRVISLTRRKDGPGRPYSLPHARMSLANPKENVPYGSERSSTLCSRLAKAREGSDRITLSAPVEQKACADICPARYFEKKFQVRCVCICLHLLMMFQHTIDLQPVAGVNMTVESIPLLSIKSVSDIQMDDTAVDGELRMITIRLREQILLQSSASCNDDGEAPDSLTNVAPTTPKAVDATQKSLTARNGSVRTLSLTPHSTSNAKYILRAKAYQQAKTFQETLKKARCHDKCMKRERARKTLSRSLDTDSTSLMPTGALFLASQEHGGEYA